MIRSGIIFYALFGLGWLLAGLGHFGGTILGAAGTLGLVVALTLVLVARRLPPERSGGAGQPLPQQTGRNFARVNALQWFLIAAIAIGCGAGGVPEMIMPLVAIVVGLHFIPLSRIFGDLRLVVPGAILAAIGFAGLLAWAAHASPGAVLTLVGVGCALTLWSTAIWSLAGAARAARS